MYLKRSITLNWGNLPNEELEYGPVNLFSGGNFEVVAVGRVFFHRQLADEFRKGGHLAFGQILEGVLREKGFDVASLNLRIGARSDVGSRHLRARGDDDQGREARFEPFGERFEKRFPGALAIKVAIEANEQF